MCDQFLKKYRFLLIFLCFLVRPEEGIIIEDEVPIVHSNALPSPGADSDVRFIAVYLPFEATIDPEKTFPVIYYFPGLGGNQDTFVDGNASIMDTLLTEKRITPLIIVHVDPSLVNGIDTDGKRRYEGTWYLNSSLNHDFETFIVEDLIPYVDANYPTKNSKEFRAIAGQSMGGYGATWLGMKHPELFCGMGSASGTPFWSLITNVVPNVVDPGSINPPGDVMFVANSLALPEIPTSGPDTGKITPDNGEFTFDFFSYSGALSSNISKPPFFVNLPFLVDNDNNPVLTTGSFIVANEDTGERSTVSTSFTPDQTIINQWKIESPYIRAPEFQQTLTRQAIYLDGGDVELINAVGARQMSDKFVSLNVDHEYLLYHGNHDTCLLDESCSRNQTMFQLLAAKFAEGGLYTDLIRTPIIGTGTIELHDNCVLQISDHHILSVETNKNLAITDTDITFELFDNAKILIGDAGPGNSPGVLQIGNQFTKSTLAFDPSLQDHHISCTFTMHSGEIEIQKGGLWGLGVGVNGFFPVNLNEWALSSLTNVDSLSLQFLAGTVSHQIFSNEDFQHSLIAYGPSAEYNFFINPVTATMLGGGAVLSLPDGYLVLPIAFQQVGEKLPGGIRNDINSDPDAIDYFFQKPMGSTLFYLNRYEYGLFLNSNQLALSGFSTPFSFTTTSIDEFFTRLSLFLDDNYTQVLQHSGIVNFTEENTVEIIVLDDAGTVFRFTGNTMPNPQNINLVEIAQTVGYVDVVCQVTNGSFTLLRIDDPRV